MLKWLFCIWVLALAIYQFSENTADPDLWGHTLFGQQILKTGTVPKVEMFSWTEPARPWINHEVLAEVALGWTHQQFGGSGILLLKMLVGLLTFLLALRIGAEKLPWPTRAFAWAFAALAVVELSFGFSPRPQIFTALAIACELWILKRLHEGSCQWALAIPVLFALWINTHGGALAGLGLLLIVAVGTSAQVAIHKSGGQFAKLLDDSTSSKTIIVLWLSFFAAIIGMIFNPWGSELLKWLLESVFWLRPEIDEWNPTPFDWDHVALFALIALSLFSWIFSRRRKMAWEILACVAFAILALRSVRNTPLFAIVALATVPQHLADACLRFRHLIAHREELLRQQQTQTFLANFFWITTVGILAATFLLRKDHPLTIEVPKKQYPVSAIEFIKRHELRGNLFVFFDWGEMCIWELPESPVSIDGRLDTCYSRELIKEHWRVYNGQSHDENVLPMKNADFALLPKNLEGALVLSKEPGWQLAYIDDRAVVLVRNPQRFPLLIKENLPVLGVREVTLPVIGEKNAAIGRVAFPDKPSLRIGGVKSP